MGLDDSELVAQAYGELAAEDPAGPRPAALPSPDTSLGPHLSYAFQWWIFALFFPGALIYRTRRLFQDVAEDERRQQDPERAETADTAPAPRPGPTIDHRPRRAVRAGAGATTRRKRMPSSISRRRERTAVPRSRFLPGPRPRRIAHRGFALDGAENTMRAFEDALAAGADMLETDTRATRDGLALAVHDEDLLRVAGDERRIDEIGAREAGAVRLAGDEPLAMLEDVLATFTDVPINVDVKAASAIGPAVAAIARTRSAERVCIAGFDGDVVRKTLATLHAATGVLPVRSASRGVIAGFLAARAVEAPRP